jgi:hypothetical protein
MEHSLLRNTGKEAANCGEREGSEDVGLMGGHSHDDEDGADDNALNAASKDWVRNDGEGLVDNHVGEEEGNQKEVTVLADWFYFVGIFTLLTMVRLVHVSGVVVNGMCTYIG